MNLPSSTAAASALFLAACAIGDARYPIAWEPIPPAASRDCRGLEGSYRDRGEIPQQETQASLTREIFGSDSPWKRAHRVDFVFLREGMLEVVVWSEAGRLLAQTYSVAHGELACDAGRLKIQGRRWVAEDMVMGREDFTIEFNQAGRFLVARVNARTFGTIFLIVPVSADATHWYRFTRLGN